jgi:hypothetical protein
MGASFQFSTALKALDFIEKAVVREKRYTTYNEISKELGLGSNYARPIGQVISRIDAACFYANLPYLASAKVRNEGGEINKDSFSAPPWNQYRSQLIDAANNRAWSTEDFTKIKRILSTSLPEDAATLLWEKIDSFGEKAIEKSLASSGIQFKIFLKKP